ncbi:MAG: HlyD family efflux transporter periplasmic adaptor subunit, partial [Rhodospirillales bacterium]
GAWVNAGQPVVTLLSDSDLEIEAAVPSRIIDGVKPGIVVKVRLGETAIYDAAIRAVIPEENPLTRTRIVRAIPDLSSDARLAAGQSAIMLVPIGEPRDVITVHKDAVLNRGGANLVVLVVDGKAEFRPIQIGDAVGSRFEVLNGLAAGDVAVVRGNERLRPGQPVAPTGKGKPGGGSKAPECGEKPAAAKTDSNQKAQGES